MSKNYKKLLFVLSLILALVIIPTCFAADNTTLADESDSVLSANEVYFDASNNLENQTGSIENPYQNITFSNIKTNSVNYFADGEYEVDFSKSLYNVTIIGNNPEKTVINANDNQFNIYTTLTLKNITLVGLGITNMGDVNITAENVIFKDSSNSVIKTKAGYDNTNVTLKNCTFSNNYASYGGAINFMAGNLDIYNCIFINNAALNSGGAIYAKDSNVTVQKSKFIKNTAKNDAGGAIFAKNAYVYTYYLNITDSTATFGAGVTSLSSFLDLNHFYARNNTAKYDGGAVYFMYEFLAINDSVIELNSARNGGGLFVDNAESFQIYRNTFTNNIASNRAGAVYSILSDPDYDSIGDSHFKNTFTNNKASYNNDYYESKNLDLNIGNGNYTFIRINETVFDTLPSLYTSPYTTSVKSQGSGGNCWSFTALGTLEACIKKAIGKEYDFSEENMKNIMSRYSDYGWAMETNVGGYDDMGYGYLVSWLGPVNESDDPYNPSSELSSIYESLFHVQNILFIQRTSQTDTEAIKEAIYKYGAVGTCIYWSSSYARGSSYYYNGENGANHAVTIVGWDDNYSKNNFKSAPAGNGAWLIKNSWGTNSGDKGYYYVSYYDTRIALYTKTDATFTFVLNESVKYDKNYQYDIPGRTDFFVDKGNTVWYKNIFTATDDEYLAAVSTYFEYATNWTVNIIVNNVLKHTQSGSSPAGYFTINLDSIIPLKTGDVFEVVFNVSNGRGETSFPISEAISLNNQMYYPGISYFSKDGKTWTDLVDYSASYSSHTYYSQVACIKAFTIFDELKTNMNINVVFNKENTTDFIAQIFDEYGNTVKSGEVTFTVSGNTFKSQIKNGYARYTYNLKKGDSLVSAVYNGIGYISSDASYHFNFTNIISQDITYYYGNVVYEITLKDINTNGLAGKKIIFTLNNMSYERTTDRDGKASIDVSLDMGKYTVNVIFEGDENYMNSNATNTINAISSINLPSNTKYTYSAPYTLTLLDFNGDKLKNADVNIVVGGVKYSYTTDASGKISHTVKLKPGSYSVSVVNPKTLETLTQKITVSKRITENRALTMYYLSGKSYTVRVYDDNAKVAAGVKVTFKVNGKTYTVTSDKNGYASLKINLKPKTYTISATYKGYSVSNKIVVKPTIVTKDITVKKGKVIKFTAKLLDKNGKVIKNKKITFKFKGKTYKIKTNSKGIATLKITKKYKVGKYTVTSAYGSLKISNKITVKK